MLRSGIAPIDERLGGLTPRKPHLLTGPPGSGKTSICLGFLALAVSDGRSAAILTEDDPKELVGHAADLGLDLRRAAATGRFGMVRYRRDFASRLEHAASPEQLVDELVLQMGPGAPDCIAIDSVLPFLGTGSASRIGVVALTQALDRLRATAIVTYPGDVRDHYDRRLDPLVRRCAALLHLSSYSEGVGRMDVVKSRARLWSDSPAFFSIQPGRGVVAFDASLARTDGAASDLGRRSILLFPGPDGLPEDLLVALRGAFSVAVHGDTALIAPEVVPPDVGAIVVAARWDAIADATRLLRRLRQLGNRTPVVLVTRGEVRSSDRASAVRAGFDEVIGDAAASDELIARLIAVLRRGRSTTLPIVAPEDVGALQSPEDGLARALDEPQFRAAVASAVNGKNGRLFSVLFLSPGDGQVDELVTLVTGMTRARGGDVVGIVGDGVALYLPGMRDIDATPIAKRVSNEWRRAGGRELRVVQLAYPADRERLRADLRLPASTVHPSTPPTVHPSLS